MQGTQNDQQKSSTDLDLDEWLESRQLVHRRIKVGGRWFKFNGAATSEEVVKISAALNEGDLFGTLRLLLCKPSEGDALEAAFKKQKQPVGAKREAEFMGAIISHLFHGVDVGESSAS